MADQKIDLEKAKLRAPARSWWAQAERNGFTRMCWQEWEARMQFSLHASQPRVKPGEAASPTPKGD